MDWEEKTVLQEMYESDPKVRQIVHQEIQNMENAARLILDLFQGKRKKIEAKDVYEAQIIQNADPFSLILYNAIRAKIEGLDKDYRDFNLN